MVEQRSEAEMLKAAMLKKLRAAIRTEFSVLADYKLNEVLPEACKRFDAAWQRGQLLSDEDVKALVRKVVG